MAHCATKLDLLKNSAQVFSWFTHNPKLKLEKFLELILLNYCCLIMQCMEVLFEKTFVIFDRLSIK